MRRRAVVLPVVLLMIVLLALIGAMFAFHVHADVASLRAVETRLQTRLAAEAGVEYVKLMLRTSRSDRSRWYSNPEELNRVLVWADGTPPQDWGLNREWNDRGMAYRFSIVADDPTDDEQFARFGITDESSKLNLNTATSDQLAALVKVAVAGDDSVDPQAIVDAILDWRDADSEPTGDEPDTEGEYYRSLPKPYLVKNAPFDSVEELLLVKGVTERVLYGEDRDRNGLMTPNENDGDQLYPADNQDGVLDRGLYPYLTVVSAENNVGADNRARTYLYTENEVALREALAGALDEKGEWIDFVIQTIKARPRTGGKPSKPSGGSGGTGDGKSGPNQGGQPGEGGSQSGGQNPPGTGGTPGGGSGGESDGGAGPPPSGSGGDAGGGGGGSRAGSKPPGGSSAGPKPGGPAAGPKSPGSKPPKPEAGTKPPTNPKSRTGSAKLQSPAGSSPHGGGSVPGPSSGGKPKGSGGTRPPSGGDGTPSVGGGGVPGADGNAGEEPAGPGSEDEAGSVGDDDSGGSGDGPSKDGGGQESGGGAGGAQPIRSPAAFFVDQTVDGAAKPSPLPIEYLAVMLDRFTAVPPTEQKIRGLVNVNTAPRPVLRTLPFLTEQQIDAIVEVRDGLSAEVSSTPAWLVTTGAVDINSFERVAHLLTARGQQFMVESVGFADHTGMVTRLQVVLDMLGPVAQTIYYRDLSQLGGRFPIREADQRRSKRGR